jgi:prevent-host-death family protein
VAEHSTILFSRNRLYHYQRTRPLTPSTQVKNKFGEILKQVYAQRNHIIVEKSGIPVAVIVPISLYNPLYSRRKDADPNVAEKLDIAAETTISLESAERLKRGYEGKEVKPSENQD